jgi:hypothetical protein
MLHRGFDLHERVKETLRWFPIHPALTALFCSIKSVEMFLFAFFKQKKAQEFSTANVSHTSMPSKHVSSLSKVFNKKLMQKRTRNCVDPSKKE